MYDHDIVGTAELIAAQAAWPQTSAKARQHKGAAVRAGLTRRLSLRAKKAWLTRKARS